MDSQKISSWPEELNATSMEPQKAPVTVGTMRGFPWKLFEVVFFRESHCIISDHHPSIMIGNTVKINLKQLPWEPPHRSDGRRGLLWTHTGRVKFLRPRGYFSSITSCNQCYFQHENVQNRNNNNIYLFY